MNDVDNDETTTAHTSSTDVRRFRCRLNVPMLIVEKIARSWWNAIKLKELKCFPHSINASKTEGFRLDHAPIYFIMKKVVMSATNRMKLDSKKNYPEIS